MSKPVFMHTASNKAFYLIDQQPASVSIEDIAHSLSGKGRYSDMTPSTYSVAQHCYYVSVKVEEALRSLLSISEREILVGSLWGLLHDAHEAYIGDMISPVKSALAIMLPEIKEAWSLFEKKTDETIQAGLEIPACDITKEAYAAIHNADLRMCTTEFRDMFGEPADLWDLPKYYPPYDFKVYVWNRETAKTTFLDRYEELRARIADYDGTAQG